MMVQRRFLGPGVRLPRSPPDQRVSGVFGERCIGSDTGEYNRSMQKIFRMVRASAFIMGPFLLGSLLFLTSACSSLSGLEFGPLTSSSTDLAQSMLAMAQVHTMHVTEQMTAIAHLRGAIKQDMTLSVEGSGDDALPVQGQEQATFTLTMPARSSSLVVRQVYSHQRLYIQPKQGQQWFVADTGGLPHVHDLVLALMQQNEALSQLFKPGQFSVTDHGMETIGGQQMRHLSVAFTTSGIKQLLALSKPKQKAEQQSLAQVQCDLYSAHGALDLWLDPTTHRIGRIGLSMAVQAIWEKVSPSTPAGKQSSQVVSMNATLKGSATLSAFNQAVGITIPQTATPIQLPLVQIR